MLRILLKTKLIPKSSLAIAARCSTLLHKPLFPFSKKIASKIKSSKTTYEETEKDLNDLIEVFEPSEDEGIDLEGGGWDAEKDQERGEIGNYHFIVERDPAKAALHIQNFVMKANEALSPVNLREFLHLLDGFKVSMGSYDYKKHKILKNKQFLRKAARVFNKDQAIDLIYMLMACDVTRISHENFSSTVFNFDEEIEIKNKITKFNDFMYSAIPKSKPLVSDLEAKHKRFTNTEHIQSEDQSDLNLLSKISKMKFQNEESKQLINEKKEGKVVKESAEFVNDLEEDEEKSRNQTDKMILEIVNNEIEQKLSSQLNYANEIKEEILKTQEPSQSVNFDQNFGISDFYIEKTRAFLHETYTMKPEMRLQQPKEILILKQKQFATRSVLRTNWVYLSGLPYSIENLSTWEEELKKKLENFAGKIKNIKILLYKDFLSLKQENDRTYSLNSQVNLESIFLPQDLKRASKTATKEKGTSEEDSAAITTPTVGEILKSLNLDVGENLEKNNSKKKKTKTDKILNKIKEKNSKKLDRSYALVEFSEYESKERALIPELRVFGLKVAESMLFIDDADFKLTLICNNVHWGASLQKFCEKLNSQFEKENILDLQLEIKPEDEKKIITKYFILLRFNNFPNTVKALYALRDFPFENRVLRLNHLYGPLKKFKSNYYEILDNDSISEILGKIDERKQFEFSRILARDEEDIVICQENPDLLLEEGMNQSPEVDEEYPPFFMHEHPEEEAIEDKYKRVHKKLMEDEELERLERERFH